MEYRFIHTELFFSWVLSVNVWRRTIRKLNLCCVNDHLERISNHLNLSSFSELVKDYDLKMIKKYVKEDLTFDNLTFNVPQFYSRKIDFLFVPTNRLEKSSRSFWNRASRSRVCKLFGERAISYQWNRL